LHETVRRVGDEEPADADGEAGDARQDAGAEIACEKGDEDNEVRVFELGADDFLTKPFRAKALSKRLEVVLARRKE